MSLTARRPWGALLLAVLMAAPTMKVVPAAASPTSPGSAIHGSVPAHVAATHKKKKSIAHRPLDSYLCVWVRASCAPKLLR